MNTTVFMAAAAGMAMLGGAFRQASEEVSDLDKALEGLPKMTSTRRQWKDNERAKKGIISPALRAAACADFVFGSGITNADMASQAALQLTPPLLRQFPDRAVRGKKSLGRIQQLTGTRRYKKNRRAA